MKTGVFLVLFLGLSFSCTHSDSRFSEFVTRQGDKLMDGDEELRFISFNIPGCHYIEDNMAFDETNPFRLPDVFEMKDAILSIRQMGGQVFRIYVLPVRDADDSSDVPKYVLGPGSFDEEAFRTLDKMMQLANRYGIRVIIPFVDNWRWWGGIAQYARFRGKESAAFWTDPQLIADFKQTIHYLINRKNVYTGSLYRDDKAILAWETGNELQSTPEWVSEIAAYIKSLDPNHLVMDGFHSSRLREKSIEDPNVDIVTTHHYPRNPAQLSEEVKSNRVRSKDKKPYIVGEFGFVETGAIETFLDEIIANGTSGALIWSLRQHNRDGGFYWHSEPFGGDRYKAYHWPGFRSGHEYDEIALLRLMREKAFAIQGFPAPAIATPEAPVLLPIADVSAISWRGSVGASSYDVERSQNESGPWQIVGADISDAAVQYRPLFNDTSAQTGQTYHYRVVAKNSGGKSQPSDAVLSPEVVHLTLVDECADLNRTAENTGELTIETKNARAFKEDIHRIKGEKGASLSYRVPGDIKSCTIYAFFQNEIADPAISVSDDGSSWVPLSLQRGEYFSGAGEYGYAKPVLFNAVCEGKASALKCEFTGTAELSRIEIKYAK